MSSTPTNTITPLELETRETVTTREAAYHLHHAPQTLRIWACTERGLIRPIRIGRRLGWRVSDIRALLGV